MYLKVTSRLLHGKPPGSLWGTVGQVVLDVEAGDGEDEDGDGHDEEGGVDHGGSQRKGGHLLDQREDVLLLKRSAKCSAALGDLGVASPWSGRVVSQATRRGDHQQYATFYYREI